MLRLSVMQAKMVRRLKTACTTNSRGKAFWSNPIEEEQLVSWENCTKASGSETAVYIFTGKKNAFILPKADMKEKTEDVLRIIGANMARKR